MLFLAPPKRRVSPTMLSHAAFTVPPPRTSWPCELSQETAAQQETLGRGRAVGRNLNMVPCQDPSGIGGKHVFASWHATSSGST